MIKRNFISIKKLLILGVIPALAFFSHAASAGNIPEADGACGSLTPMGDHTKIYNNSMYAWNVVFKTDVVSTGTRSVNAGAVKYLSDGIWIDNGTGDYRATKAYSVPVDPGQTVRISYCSDRSEGDFYIEGAATISWNYTGNWNYANNAHGTPDANVEFRGKNRTPLFHNHGTTAYVSYNKNLKGVFEDGSLTICPNDPECKVP